MKKFLRYAVAGLTFMIALTALAGVASAASIFMGINNPQVTNSPATSSFATSPFFSRSPAVSGLGITGSIPLDFDAPSVAHSVEGAGADQNLKFPYRLDLTGMNNALGSVTSFRFYVVDTLTREIVTMPGHIGTVFHGGPAVMSPCGDFIELTPSSAFPPGVVVSGRTFGQMTILLQHGQEVFVTTESTIYNPDDYPARGLDAFFVSSFFWTDGEPIGFSPPPAFPGPTPSFGLAHADYAFHLNNPHAPWLPIFGPNTPPQHFSPGLGLPPSYAEGFAFNTGANLQDNIINSTVRVEAVWTRSGYTPTQPPCATMPLTKVLETSVDATATVPATSFTFNFTPLNWDGSSTEATLAAMPTISSPAGVSFTSVETTTTLMRDIEILDVLEGITFPGTGVFVYSVTEDADTNTLPAGWSLSYSPAEYELRIDVRQGPEGLYIYDATVIVRAVDNLDPDAPALGEVLDELTFTNVLTHTLELPCDECGEYPCICEPSEPTTRTVRVDFFEVSVGTPRVAHIYLHDVPVGTIITLSMITNPAGFPRAGFLPGVLYDLNIEVTAEGEIVVRVLFPLRDDNQPPPPPEDEGEVAETTPTVPVPTPPINGDDSAGTETSPTAQRTSDGAGPGPQTGDLSNPSLHLLNMIAAAVIAVVVALRLRCSKGALTESESE
ncbi:MAG: hypothetical protein FWC99_02255 [Coriobacteriia bacterium]|nr:hypothetical protein [Coriobacteriia bacterium]